ncbi:MAG: TIGR02453 family protein [Chitinophagales bacterium]|nr:MAG: TIGR02453 family protein [Chitinophagales bacterium]
MPVISESTLQFLKALKRHNNRDWFQANRDRYTLAQEEFSAWIDALIPELAAVDPDIALLSARDCIFRIYRDTRFSKDKSPYKVHLGAHLTPAAKKTDVHAKAGYYVHIQPGASMLAGGAYMPEPVWLKAIRQEIDYNAAELKKILNSKNFKKYFGQMVGETLKTHPRDYPPDHPEIALLKHKSFLAVHRVPDQKVTDAGFLKHAVKVFSALYPFNQFFNRALD